MKTLTAACLCNMTTSTPINVSLKTEAALSFETVASTYITAGSNKLKDRILANAFINSGN
jgi:hypothetical protein